MSVTQFEIDGVAYRVERMALDASLKGFGLVGSVCGPALDGMVRGNGGALIQGLTAGIGRLPELLRLFEPLTKIEQAGRWVEFRAFREDLFRGRLDSAVLYVANCVQAEYGAFLDAGLDRVKQGLGELFPALREPIPSSGDSSSTHESETP